MNAYSQGQKLEYISVAQYLVQNVNQNFSGCIKLKETEDEIGFRIFFRSGIMIGVTGISSLVDKILQYQIKSHRVAVQLRELEQKANEQKFDIYPKLIKAFGVEESHLERLFKEQVAEIYQRFNQQKGRISKHTIGKFCYSEITGFSINIKELILEGLEKNISEQDRNLLPRRHEVIETTNETSSIVLEPYYRKIVTFADSKLTIEQIARKLNQPIDIVAQRIYGLKLINAINSNISESEAIKYLNRFSKGKEVLDNRKINLDSKNSWQKPVIAISVINAITILLTYSGVFQNIELGFLDRFYKLRGTTKNETVTLVTIDEADITKLGQYPISDRKLALALTNIARHEPLAIGIDIYRDIPNEPGSKQLKEVFESVEGIVGVEKIIQPKVAPPPILKDYGFVGFSDLPEDSDSILRRGLVSVIDGSETRLGLGSFLAIYSLGKQGIEFSNIEGSENKYRLGEEIITSLTKASGGYWKAEIEGLQMMLNYRHQRTDFDEISFSNILNREFNPALIKDRIVIVGVAAPSEKDYFYTPYSRNNSGRTIPMLGMVVHANIASQLLGVAQGEKIIAPKSKIWEIRYFIAWSIIGVGLGTISLQTNVANNENSTVIVGAECLGLGVLSCIAGAAAFAMGWWIPVVVPAICGITSFLIVNLQYKSQVENLIYLDKKSRIPNRYYFNRTLKQDLELANLRQLTIGLILCQIHQSANQKKSAQLSETIKAIAKNINLIVKAENADNFTAKFTESILAVVVVGTNASKLANIIDNIQATIDADRKTMRGIKLTFGSSVNTKTVNNSSAMIAQASETI